MMLKNFLFPTQQNHYNPAILSRGFVLFYTLLLLVFNVFTSNIESLKVSADVDSQSLLELHNLEREKRGLKELTLNSALSASAKAKAEAMLEANCWDHYCPNNKSPWDFFLEAGYDYIYGGENLAEGFFDNEKVFSAWMNSKTHRENILRGDFEEVGIAIVYGDFQDIKDNALIVVHFGTRADTQEITASNDSSDSLTNPQNKEFYITKPANQEVLNNNTPTIEGVSPDGMIDIKVNEKLLERVSANEGIFTYKVPNESALVDGTSTISALNLDTGEKDTSTVMIDTIAPTIQSLELLETNASSNGSECILELITDDDVVELDVDIDQAKIFKKTSTTWNINLDSKIIDEKNSITVTIYDHASNSEKETYDLTNIKNAVAGEMTSKDQDLNVSGTLDIKEIGIRRIVNVIFIAIIMLLLVADYIIIVNTQVTSEYAKKRLSHHFSVFAMLLLISIAGGTAGELLNAQST